MRINLSEQTDLADLLTDLPLPDNDHDVVEDNGVDSSQVYPLQMTPRRAAWCDGVLLRAIKNGDWVFWTSSIWRRNLFLRSQCYTGSPS